MKFTLTGERGKTQHADITKMISVKESRIMFPGENGGAFVIGRPRKAMKRPHFS